MVESNLKAAPPEDQEGPLAREAAPMPLPRRFPVMSLALAAVLVLMAVAQFVAGGAQYRLDHLGSPFSDWALGAKVPSLIAHGEYWRLVTANYLHGSIGHLLCNLIPLALFGWLMETFYGRARMFVIYTLAGVAGAIISYQATDSVSLGASTGVMGLLGALLVHNFRYRRYLNARINRLYPLLVAGLCLQFVVDVAYGKGIDVAGHVGGLLGGAVIAGLMESRIAGPHQGERDWLPLPTGLITAVLLIGYGGVGLLLSLPEQVPLIRAGRAEGPRQLADELALVTARRPYFLEARLEYSAALLNAGDRDAARDAYLRLAREFPRVAALPDAAELRTEIAFTYFQAAQRAYRASNWEDSLTQFKVVIDLDPRPRLRAPALNTYAWTLADKLDRDYDEAERRVREALVLEPDEPAFIDTLAWVHYKQGRYVDALNQQLRAVIEVRKMPAFGTAEYFYHLGAIYEKLKRPGEAAANYREALLAQPAYGEARAGLKRVAPTDPFLRPPTLPRRLPLDPAERRGLI